MRAGENGVTMERMIIMRHGEAQRPAPGLEDFERALDATGRAESRGIGRALAEAGLAPDVALVSGAARTQETWRCAAEAFSEANVLVDDSLYAASAARLAGAVKVAAPLGRTVILVGHNPGVHQYAVHLARQAGASAKEAAPLFDRFPTGTAVVFRMDAEGQAAFERIFLAKHYRDAAR